MPHSYFACDEIEFFIQLFEGQRHSAYDYEENNKNQTSSYDARDVCAYSYPELCMK